METQRISNFYIPGVSDQISLSSTDTSTDFKQIKEESKADKEHKIFLTPGIVDFWSLNFNYKKNHRGGWN